MEKRKVTMAPQNQPPLISCSKADKLHLERKRFPCRGMSTSVGANVRRCMLAEFDAYPRQQYSQARRNINFLYSSFQLLLHPNQGSPSVHKSAFLEDTEDSLHLLRCCHVQYLRRGIVAAQPVCAAPAVNTYGGGLQLVARHSVMIDESYKTGITQTDSTPE